MKILLTGSTGFIGRSLAPKLKAAGHDVVATSRSEYDLSDQVEARRLFKDVAADAVIHLAGKVGGILANKTMPADFTYQNLAVNTYFLEEARKAGIKRLIYPFCGCSYPKTAQNPIKEETLFTGMPDENSMFYSLSKAANHLQVVSYRRQYGLDWVSVVPGNAYGPHDNFSENNSHVIPALIRRFYFAKQNSDRQITVWGSGSPIRDFIYVDDVSDGIVAALSRHHTELPINISSGRGVSIKELVGMVAQAVGYGGEIAWDRSKPDGQALKVFDVTRMKSVLGFTPAVSLEEGIARTCAWFGSNSSVANA